MGMFLRRGAVASGPKLGDIEVGTIVKLNENGSPADFYVAKHDYESILNGTGRTLLVRKECADDVKFSYNYNIYADGLLDTFLNETFFQRLDAGMRAKIVSTKFYYTPGDEDSTLKTLERTIFQLSLTELGFTSNKTNVEGSALPIASTLKVAYRNGSAVNQWTRTPSTSGSISVYYVTTSGASAFNSGQQLYGSRPAFCLPAETKVGDGSLITG